MGSITSIANSFLLLFTRIPIKIMLTCWRSSRFRLATSTAFAKCMQYPAGFFMFMIEEAHAHPVGSEVESQSNRHGCRGGGTYLAVVAL